MDLRLLTEADEAESTLMSHHAFGVPADGRAVFILGPEIRRWAILDGKTLAAKANDRSYDSMIGGRRVPTAGVAGVAVAPEYRATGLARQIMTHLLEQARDRGAVISTLFRSAPALYRSLGYEQIAELVDCRIPTSALRGIKPDSTTLRRAVPADVPAIRQVYADVAAGGSCMLTRDGAAFDSSNEDFLASADGFSLAVGATGEVVGYVSWNRGQGYTESAVLSVVDLLATTGDGYRALLAMVGSFGAVTPTVRFRTSGTDPVQWAIPGTGWAVEDVRPYMLRVVDLAGAVSGRGWPAGAVVDVVLEIDDAICPWNSGRHRLRVAGGIGSLESAVEDNAGSPTTRLSCGGLAVLYAGGVQVSTLRRAGLVEGGSPASDAQLDAALAGPRPSILDYF